MIKRICLTSLSAILLLVSCKLKNEQVREQELWQKKVDSTGNAMLDSIYNLKSLRCDSMTSKKLPAIVDSLLKAKRKPTIQSDSMSVSKK